MTKLEKIVYLADKIEPNTREEEFRNKVLNKLKETQNLDEALLICYEATIKSLLDRKMIINIQTIEIWNNLIFIVKSLAYKANFFFYALRLSFKLLIYFNIKNMFP
ncbi:MAG: hypothetical protein MZV64_27610 [Ignavibacteriales bacterium]|nr:hypothetical protein [Ignavibacteriales bacterium]